MKKIVVLLLPVLILLSCSVQKRKYQKGFYVSWKHASQNERSLSANEVKPIAKKEIKTVKTIDIPSKERESVLASTGDETTGIIKSTNRASVFHGDDPCDNIVFKDGTELNAKIIEVTPTEIKYKKCDLPDGPVYVVRNSEIFMVKYGNGTREVFQNTPNTTTQNPNSRSNKSNVPPRIQPFAIISLICGILGLIPFFYGLLSIGAIIFGSVALRLIREYPETYRGEGLARAGKILGIVGVVIGVIIIIAIFALIFSI